MTAKIKYTDGSAHEKCVNWKTDGIDFSKPGSYVVEGKIVARHETSVYKNTFWAPEFYIVGDKMRIFCALTVGTGFEPRHKTRYRAYALRC